MRNFWLNNLKINVSFGNRHDMVLRIPIEMENGVRYATVKGERKMLRWGMGWLELIGGILNETYTLHATHRLHYEKMGENSKPFAEKEVDRWNYLKRRCFGETDEQIQKSQPKGQSASSKSSSL